MEIRPMYENTIKMSVTNIKLETMKQTKEKNDLYKEIPNGILKVIKWEFLRQWITIAITFILIVSMIVLISVYSTITHVSWTGYVIPSTTLILSTWKILITISEKKRMNKDIVRYKENIRMGLTSTPQFLVNMYKTLHRKQISHNWFTMTVIFYGGISTLLLWWLKDTTWWIFDFKSWISSWFASPDLMAWIFTISLIVVIVIHAIFAINRKKRILDLDSYFGEPLMNETDLQSLKVTLNKTYRRLFIFSIMILMIIPMVIKFVFKMIRKK
ncbi:MAG: hypothetical protein KAG14_02250 [Mycoplasmataceae bacterium]|nr:hypothetical protein [Mycoplasmataceae bacterium]